MKILVLFTGGTIGSSVHEGIVSVDSAASYRLLAHFARYKNEIEFVPAAPYSILSENLSGQTLQLLQAALAEGLAAAYDGIIVTHGTDTLLYSAAAAAYAFGDCAVPVVFVSANLPLENSLSNGYQNFEAAVEFIKSGQARGVFVSYKNTDCEQTQLHLATRILQYRECDANLYSIDGAPFATYTDRISINAGPCAQKQALGIVPYTDTSRILVLDSHPGDAFAYATEGVCAVLIKPYHSATLNTQSPHFAAFCKRLAEESIPIVAVNVRGGDRYASTSLFEALQIRTLPYSTFTSVYMKAWAADSLGMPLLPMLQKQIAGEFADVQ